MENDNCIVNLKILRAATSKSFSRASGPGGQNVNKKSSKVHLNFSIQNSKLMTKQKERLLKKFPNGIIHVVNQDSRSQWMNAVLAFDHLQSIIERSLKIQKKRKKTIPPYKTILGKKGKIRKEHLLKYRQRYLE